MKYNQTLNINALSDSAFWAIIEASKAGSWGEPARQKQILAQTLSKLTEAKLIAYDLRYDHYLDQAQHWDLWSALYIINNYCSDDSFDYFKDWLISQGQVAYHSALFDVENLVGIANPNHCDFETFRYVQREIFEEQFGKEMPYNTRDYPTMQGDKPDEEAIHQQFPRLSAWIKLIKGEAL